MQEDKRKQREEPAKWLLPDLYLDEGLGRPPFAPY